VPGQNALKHCETSGDCTKTGLQTACISARRGQGQLLSFTDCNRNEVLCISWLERPALANE